MNGEYINNSIAPNRFKQIEFDSLKKLFTLSPIPSTSYLDYDALKDQTTDKLSIVTDPKQKPFEKDPNSYMENKSISESSYFSNLLKVSQFVQVENYQSTSVSLNKSSNTFELVFSEFNYK